MKVRVLSSYGKDVDEAFEKAIADKFNLHDEIERQKFEGQFVIAPLSMLRCSECGDLLDFDGRCKNHGATDA